MTDNRLQQLLSLIDDANGRDPNRETADGKSWPKEQLYSHRMTTRLREFMPEAPEVLRIAAHAQHIERWTIPRSDFPKTRPGYLQWRRQLGHFHADRTAELMAATGYPQDYIETVRKLLTKQQLKQDPLVQALEDVICLVFIEFYLADFAADYDRAKLIRILQKTWAKMSDRGHQAALQLPLPGDMLALIREALDG